MKARPRSSPRNLGLRSRLKTAWDFKTSIFREYKPDTDATRIRCFEFDWNTCKLQSLIKSKQDLQEVRSLLYKNYKGIRELYKY